MNIHIRENISFQVNLSTNILSLIKVALDAMRPPERVPVSVWADRERILPETANEPGKYRSSRTPHAVAIMDAFVDPQVEEISLMGSAQIAKTTIQENIIGYTIDIDPKPILFMAPTLDVAKKFSKNKLEPMIEDTPSLKRKVSKRKSRDSDNTALYKKFEGGFIVMVGANSPHSLRQMSIPIIISDDIDSIEIGSTKEGDPVDRAEKRAQTFEGQSKKFRASTPTIDGSSRIYNYYKQGTMEKPYVRCLHCGHQQVLNWENVVWDYDKDAFGKKIKGTDNPASAKISCVSCGVLMDESERLEMLKNIEWIAEHPERIRHRSFWINEISSTLSSLKRVVEQYLAVEDEPEKEQTFTNLVLGLPYRVESIEEISEFELMNRLESYLNPLRPYEVPNSILMLIASVDVQADRLECEVWGYGMHYEMWIINRFKFIGDPKIPKHLPKSPWAELEKLLIYKFKRVDGVELNIVAAAIDSSFLSDEVYNFTRGYEFTRKWWAIKGARNPFAEIIPARFSVIEEKRSKYLRFGINLEKQSLFSRFKISKPDNWKEGEPLPKYIHFDESICDPEYFEQLTAEHGVKKRYGNIEYTLYEKKKSGLRNEALDLLTYNSILAKMQNPNWQKLKENLDSKKRNVNQVNEPIIISEQIVKKEKSATPKTKGGAVLKNNKITNW